MINFSLSVFSLSSSVQKVLGRLFLFQWMACTSNWRNAASTLGRWNRTQRGESLMNGMRFCRIQLSIVRGEVDAAFATTGLVTRAGTSAVVPVTGRDSPGASLLVGGFMCESIRTTFSCPFLAKLTHAMKCKNEPHPRTARTETASPTRKGWNISPTHAAPHAKKTGGFS